MKREFKGKRQLPYLAVLIVLCIFLGAVPSRAQEEEEITLIDTMESSVHFAGQSEPGTELTVTVYTYRNEEERRVFFRALVTVGQSGLYDVLLPLPVLGQQFVEIEENSTARTLVYYRYDKALPQQLTQYYLNLYDFIKRSP